MGDVSTLESFITQHRSAHVSLVPCAESVPHQLPNERTRVIHLLDAIQTSDASLQAATAHIHSSDTATGLMNNFEDAAAYLVQFDPVAKNRRKNGGPGRQQQVSGVNQHENDNDDQNDFDMKANKGKTGVELRYYGPDEDSTLNNCQKMELKEHRLSKKRGRGGDKLLNEKTSNKKPRDSNAKAMRKQMVAALKEYAKETEEQDKEDTSQDEDVKK